MKKKRGKVTTSEREGTAENPTLLCAQAFLAGGFIMTLEMLGFRMLAPYFGYSTYIWGSLIGTTMAALSLGCLIGGFLADRYPRPPFVSVVVLLAGLYLGAVSFLYRSLLLFCQNLGLVGGSIAATTLLFAFPMALLSAASPYLVRMAARESRVGSAAGRISSVSTVGSIVGTCLASFYLIPVSGSHRTLILCAACLVLLGVAGLSYHRRHWAFLAVLLLPVLANFSNPSLGKDVILSVESAYSHVEVHKVGKWLVLKPENNFIHSIYDPERIMTGNVWDYYCLAPLLMQNPRTCLVLGAGGGTSVRQYQHFWPAMHVTALDIDPVIARVATEHFGIRADSPNLEMVIEDARTFLRNRKEARYDFIQIDLFRGGVFIPFYLATREFFSDCRRDLNPGGMLIMNVNVLEGSDPDAPSLFASIGNTLADVFPTVLYVGTDTGNVVFMAFRDATHREDVVRILEAERDQPIELVSLTTASAAALKVFARNSRSPTLTDDCAPIDALTYPIARSAFGRR